MPIQVHGVLLPILQESETSLPWTEFSTERAWRAAILRRSLYRVRGSYPFRALIVTLIGNPRRDTKLTVFPVCRPNNKNVVTVYGMAKNVLIADDSSILRTVVKNSLESIPEVGECWEAANGREAFERAAASKPDLVILDLEMPGMNGLQIAEALKRRMPEVPIVLFTMYELQSWGKFANIDAIVSKPEGLDRLRECVHTLLAPH